MVIIRSVNEIILSLQNFFQLAQPDLDTKPGTVARDLMIDAPSTVLSLIYDQMSSVSQQQSLRLVVGTDLDNLAANFGIVRKQATPSTGVALLTFATLNANLAINVGSTVISNNGFAFSATNGITVATSSINFYRSIAAKYSAQLAYVGITDQYAVEITVSATTAGSAGNIGSYSMASTNITGITNVTNVSPFTGGNDQENDAAFRNRVLASFSGSSVGTQLGYMNAALGTTGVTDAYVIGPGDPLMTRDGSVVVAGPNNSLTVVSEGTGGDVDISILGSTLIQNVDTYIYIDLSNNNDPSSPKNNVVLGQIAGESNLTVSQKRITDIANGILPTQPVDGILSVTGSISGGNFVPKSVDSYGRVSGNYQLIKDTGAYAGSPWGFDTFAWISNQITNFSEALIRGQYSGQDGLTFTEVTAIPQVQQLLNITNENSIVTFNNTIIQLLHTPVTNVTRVYNITTGERYLVTNQNPSNTGTYNTTGQIYISGNTLPSPSDGLQVDYSWVINYDPFSDYNGLIDVSSPRPVTDSVDWGLANIIENEEILFSSALSGGNLFQGTTSHPITTVLTAQTFLEVDGYVQTVTSGIYTNRLQIVLNDLVNITTSIDSVRLKNNITELYNTAQGNGNIINSLQVVGIQILNGTIIILPTDTVAQAGQYVTIIANSKDVFLAGSGQSSSTGTSITIPSTQINTLATNIVLRVNYVAAVTTLFSSPVTSLPASRSGNGYLLSNNNGFNNFSITNITHRENQTVQQNLSNQFFVEINLPSTDYSLLASQVISVIRLSDGLEIWNSTNPGTIIITDGNYQLIFSGFNIPASGNKVLVIYYATDVRRFEPFSYSNAIIKSRTDSLTVVNNNFTLALNKFTNQSGLVFQIIQPNTNIVLFSGTDGYIVANGASATFSSFSQNFDTLAGLINNKLQITGSTLLGVTNDNNYGTYDLISYNQGNNTIVIKEILDNITADQISVVRVLDGQEVWNYAGTINIATNSIIIPYSTNFNVGDNVYVMFYNYDVLRQGPTRLISAITDQVASSGTITVQGTTLNLVQNAIFTVTTAGLKQNVTQALTSTLGLSSSTVLPNNIYLAKIVSAQKVITASPTDNTVLETIANFDVLNTTIQTNLFYPDHMLSNRSLLPLDFILPSTSNNLSNVSGAENIPIIGDTIQVTFYYYTTNVQENLVYTTNGTLYTNNKFALINRMFVVGGLGSSQSTKFSATSFTQPALGSRYNAFYNYTAPQQNERIVINYDSNQLVTTVTLNIENSRPITADVLVKEAILVELDLTINVVIDPLYLSTSNTVLQNLRSALMTAMTATSLGQTIDQVSLINAAQAVTGIDRARILYFNVDGHSGSIQSFPAHNNQFFEPNLITINTESI